VFSFCFLSTDKYESLLAALILVDKEKVKNQAGLVSFALDFSVLGVVFVVVVLEGFESLEVSLATEGLEELELVLFEFELFELELLELDGE